MLLDEMQQLQNRAREILSQIRKTSKNVYKDLPEEIAKEFNLFDEKGLQPKWLYGIICAIIDSFVPVVRCSRFQYVYQDGQDGFKCDIAADNMESAVEIGTKILERGEYRDCCPNKEIVNARIVLMENDVEIDSKRIQRKNWHENPSDPGEPLI